MSFLKYQRGPTDQQRVFFGRADQDGAPFRGNTVPLLKEDEFDVLTQRVCDAKWGLFDTSKPNIRMPPGDPDGRTYTEVLDGVTAGWFQLICPRQFNWGKDEKGAPTMHVYIEWAEPYRELIPQAVSRLGQSH